MNIMCKIHFPNGKLIFTHIWNRLKLNKCLKNN